MSTNQPNTSRRRWLWIGGGVALIAILAFVVLGPLRNSAGTAGSDPGAESERTAEAFMGELTANTTLSGRIEAQRAADLSFDRGGRVDEIFVAVGDAVEAGEPLVALDTTDLARAVESARQTVTIQEANLTRLLAPPTAATLAAAEASVASAQAQLDDLLAGPDDNTIAAAEASLRAANADVASASARLNSATAPPSAEEVRAAELELELARQAATSAAEQHSTILVTEPNQFLSEDRLAEIELSARTAAVQANAQLAAAQEKYDNLVNGRPSNTSSLQAQVASAVAQRDAAQTRLEQAQTGATEAQIAAARASLADTELNLATLQRGPSAAQQAAVEVQLEQARLSLERAERDLANATLTAPFAGVVTAINANSGETVNGPIVSLVAPDSLEVVSSVDEVDMDEVNPGMPALITLEGWPDTELTGMVAAIAPRGTSSGGGPVSFDIFLSFDEAAQASGLPVLVGMSADATLDTGDQGEVLLVPNAAINADRTAGTFSVNLVVRDANGDISYETADITIGARDSRNTQILSGLEAGDEVLVGPLPANDFGPGGPPPFVDQN